VNAPDLTEESGLPTGAADAIRTAVHAEFDEVLPYVVEALRRNNAFDEISDRLRAAERRILDVFPDYSQRNSASELMGYIAVHGANAGAWPPPAQRRKTEIDRAWSYVETVRRASHGMLAGALPADPTANSHWPRPAAAYQSA